MKNYIVALSIIASAIIGGIIGGGIDEIQRTAEIEQAWSGITVVADGTLIPNPSAYAYDPSHLASAKNVRIIDNAQAGYDIALHGER